MKLYDAHCHYHHLPENMLGEIDCAGSVINGTSPADWDDAKRFARGSGNAIAFGVHPWYLTDIDADNAWLDTLRGLLDAHPTASIGEIGIDHARPESEHAQAEEVFLAQLDEAAVRNRPCTVHCVRAHDRLWQLIEKRALPRRGWLLHGWSGPAHFVRKFVEHGAYFSFSAYTLTQKKPRASIHEVPIGRVLIETDAPYMVPPADVRRYELTDDAGKPFNHPANLIVGYELAAKALNMNLEDLATHVADNFTRLFGSID